MQPHMCHRGEVSVEYDPRKRLPQDEDKGKARARKAGTAGKPLVLVLVDGRTRTAQ